VVDALWAGITHKGASIDDFRHTDGTRGSFQDEFLVHRRAGKPCPRCRSVITKIRCAGRGTYLCESCQRSSELPPRPQRERLAQQIG
jgi:formamidopyrimidine-DNA glycosylase